MSRFVAALMTVIGNKVTTSVHPAMLQKLLGDAAPRDVLTARSSRATGDLEQESGIEAVKRAGRAGKSRTEAGDELGVCDSTSKAYEAEFKDRQRRGERDG